MANSNVSHSNPRIPRKRMISKFLVPLAVLVACSIGIRPCAAWETLGWLDGGGPSCSNLGCDGACGTCNSTYPQVVANCGACVGNCRGRGICCCNGREVGGCSFKLTEFNNYTTFSYLDDLSGTFNEIEFTSETVFGNIHMENHTILNVADLPSTISLGPTNPGDDVTPVGVRASGFGDILTAFFFSRRDMDRNFELGIGPVITFPSATDDILGARQWTIGPGAHFSTEIGRLTAGFFVWQSWKVGGSSVSTRTNQLFGKPFFLYELNEKWQLIYVPLGLSHSWEKKSGEDWTVPLGGGLRRRFQICDQKMGLQAQVFDYVAQKKGDPDWEFRMTVEFLFD